MRLSKYVSASNRAPSSTPEISTLLSTYWTQSCTTPTYHQSLGEPHHHSWSNIAVLYRRPPWIDYSKRGEVSVDQIRFWDFDEGASSWTFDLITESRKSLTRTWVSRSIWMVSEYRSPWWSLEERRAVSVMMLSRLLFRCRFLPASFCSSSPSKTVSDSRRWLVGVSDPSLILVVVDRFHHSNRQV